MYIWMMSVNGITTYGRTWNHLRWFLDVLRTTLDLSNSRRCMVYVHNLSYEFQFLKRQLNISEVFARRKRHPIKALINDCFEFRCSYFLSGLSLEKVAENITSVKIEKQLGKLDYTKIRHSKTELTQDELKYCEYDVLILHYFIKEEIKKNDNNITKIPLTKTGYVRRYVRDWIKKNTNYRDYHKMIVNESPDEQLFILLYKAFAGGYTHANAFNANKLLFNVGSFDESSAYPAVMLSEMFPRGKFIKRECPMTYKTFCSYLKSFACVFEIKLKNVKSISPHHTLSISKCIDINAKNENRAIVDNGRIVNAKEIVTYMTDVDYKTFKLFYKVQDEETDIEILQMYTTRYGYLPKPLIECILNMYEDKTKLKDIEEKVEEYFVIKGMFNGIYGMCVTNPVMDEIIYDQEEDWFKERPDISTALHKVYNNMNTFLSYQWGVWVTAHARYNLLSTLVKTGYDGVYCDTDSIKLLNVEKHKHIFEEYNVKIVEKLKLMCNYYALDTAKLNPEDIYGNKRMIGIWEHECDYLLFKTLGAKRYAYEMISKGEQIFQMTVSGIPKVKVKYGDDGEPIKEEDKYTPIEYVRTHGGFDFFNDDMLIPAEYSRKLTHTYCDGYFSEIVTDYNQVQCRVEEYSFINLEKQDYNMSLSEEYVNYLLGIMCAEDKIEASVRPELRINKLQVEFDDHDIIG